ncbi:MAG: hypothetical protein IJV95_02840 [Clostridia bacterium]|nr:hypothetical protein [Clostridia bacterium]
MRKNYITAPTLKEKTLSVTDMSSVTGFALNACVGQEICPSLKLKSLNVNSQVKILKFYSVYDRVFIYAEDGALYEYTDGSIIKVETLGEQPLLTGIIFSGEREILVQTTTETFIVGRKKLVSGQIPMGTCSVIYKGRLFVADKDKIYFGGPFSFDGYSINIDNYGFMGMPIETGTVKGLVVYGETLLIFTVNAIYKLTLAENVDYMVERILTPALNVADSSCKIVGDAVYFISGNRLARYKNGNVTFINSAILSGGFSVEGPCAVMDDKYLLSVYFKEHLVQCVYCYDTVSGTEQAVMVYSSIVGDGGIVVDDNDNGLYVLDGEGVINHLGYWGSKTFNFGTYYGKVLLELSLYIDRPAKLIVRGDFGMAEYVLEKGNQIKRLNLYSRTFDLEIIVKDDVFFAKDLKIKYRITEN